MFPSQATSSIAAGVKSPGQREILWDFSGLNPFLEDGEGRFPLYLAALCSGWVFALLEMSLLPWGNSHLLRHSPGRRCRRRKSNARRGKNTSLHPKSGCVRLGLKVGMRPRLPASPVPAAAVACSDAPANAAPRPGEVRKPSLLLLKYSWAEVTELMRRGLRACALSWGRNLTCRTPGAEICLFRVVFVTKNFRGGWAFLAPFGPHPAGLWLGQAGTGEATSHASPRGCSCQLPALGFTRL